MDNDDMDEDGNDGPSGLDALADAAQFLPALGEPNLGPALPTTTATFLGFLNIPKTGADQAISAGGASGSYVPNSQESQDPIQPAPDAGADGSQPIGAVGAGSYAPDSQGSVDTGQAGVDPNAGGGQPEPPKEMVVRQFLDGWKSDHHTHGGVLPPLDVVPEEADGVIAGLSRGTKLYFNRHASEWHVLFGDQKFTATGVTWKANTTPEVDLRSLNVASEPVQRVLGSFPDYKPRFGNNAHPGALALTFLTAKLKNSFYRLHLWEQDADTGKLQLMVRDRSLTIRKSIDILVVPNEADGGYDYILLTREPPLPAAGQ